MDTLKQEHNYKLIWAVVNHKSDKKISKIVALCISTLSLSLASRKPLSTSSEMISELFLYSVTTKKVRLENKNQHSQRYKFKLNCPPIEPLPAWSASKKWLRESHMLAKAHDAVIRTWKLPLKTFILERDMILEKNKWKINIKIEKCRLPLVQYDVGVSL